MVWQDFMFACSIYPGDAAFRSSVRAEARHQVRRLRHHACLALLVRQQRDRPAHTLDRTHAGDLLANPRLRRDYEAVFHALLPAEVAAHDGVTAYWPSSQWRGSLENSISQPATHPCGEQRGTRTTGTCGTRASR